MVELLDLVKFVQSLLAQQMQYISVYSALVKSIHLCHLDGAPSACSKPVRLMAAVRRMISGGGCNSE